MNEHTAKLIQALGALNKYLPRMVDDVLHGHMSPEKQHEFADLLNEVGELLHADANAEQAADTSNEPPRGTVSQAGSEEEQR